MKIWIVTQESDSDGHTGTAVFASPQGAIGWVNEFVDEANEHREEKQNRFLYPTPTRTLRVTVNGYRYTIEPDTLRK